MNARQVLVFPAGTEVGLEIYQALQYCKEVVLHGAGQSISSHAPFRYKSYHLLPSIKESGWLPALIELCRNLSIDYIFPAYDDVIVALAKHAAEIPATVLTVSLEVCEVTRSKSKTYDCLRSVVRVPEVYTVSEGMPFPVFAKPDRGQGSQGTRIVRNQAELDTVYNEIDSPIICEFLPGDEYTVDCFSDRERGVLFCGARIRLRVRNGIAMHTVSVRLDGAEAIAKKIHEALDMYGAWFFQLKKSSEDELVLLEVAPRIAGSMCTHRVMGVNFPLLTILEHERCNVQLLTLSTQMEVDRALQNRYRCNVSYHKLYIDLDDTLLIDGAVNLEALRLVFTCINKKIPVVLITRHTGDLSETLRMHRLAGLFDEVLHLDGTERKSDYIPHESAIFVDDSFSERLDVLQRSNIPTFDCSMLEALTSSHPHDC